MASLATIIFMLTIVIALFIVPLKYRFNRDDLVQLIIKRVMWVIGMFMMMQTGAILWSMAEVFQLGIGTQLRTIIIALGWVGYFMLFFTVIKSLFDILLAWKKKKYEERFGLP
jgi:hypothetical protein